MPALPSAPRNSIKGVHFLAIGLVTLLSILTSSKYFSLASSDSQGITTTNTTTNTTTATITPTVNTTIMTPNGRIVPLGSRWPGIGPFIFAARHVDHYPAAAKGSLGPGARAIGGRALGSDFNHPSGWSMYHSEEVPGFPQHPHRGFETVSIVRRGWVDHADSTGAAARYGAGDVQWVTAGNGVVHSEMFPLLHEDKANTMEMYQLWLNLPRMGKTADPEFKMLWHDAVPVLDKTDAAGRAASVRVIAGAFDGTVPPAPPAASWAADPDHDVALWLVELAPGASIELPTPNAPDTKRMLYVHGYGVRDGAAEGAAQISVDGTTVKDGSGFEQTRDARGQWARLTLTAGAERTLVLVLQGRDIGEPVVQYGPFVGNTEDDILRAFKDYRATQFGGWPWDQDGPVHPRHWGRYARHSDGRVEWPDGAPADAAEASKL